MGERLAAGGYGPFLRSPLDDPLRRLPQCCVQHHTAVAGAVDRRDEVLSTRAATGRGPQVCGSELRRRYPITNGQKISFHLQKNFKLQQTSG